MKVNSIKTRITLLNVGALALTLIVFGVLVRFSMAAMLIGSVDRDLMRMAMQRRPPPGMMPRGGPPFGQGMPGGGPRPGAPEGPFPPPEDREGRGGRNAPFQMPPPVEVPLDAPPEVIANLTIWDQNALDRAKQGEAVFSVEPFNGEPLRVYSAPIYREGKIHSVVQVAAPLGDIYRSANQLTHTLLLLIPLALLAVGVGGAFLTGQMLKPLRAITEKASRIKATSLSERLDVKGNDEFSHLAQMLNEMLQRLENAFERQRQFTADASHELKTPLAIIKTASSMALENESTLADPRRAFTSIDNAADRATRIVQDLLLLARSDAGELIVAREKLPLRSLIEQAVSSLPPRPHAPIELQIDPSLALWGDESQLTRLFTNLLENACRHTPVENGSILVKAIEEASTLRIEITDNGEGIDSEHLPRLFERFYRVDESRAREHGGTGLGLSICQTIAHAHSGEIAIASKRGVGTTVTVTLPLTSNLTHVIA